MPFLSLGDERIEAICHHQLHVLCDTKPSHVANYKNNMFLLCNICILGRKEIDKSTRFWLHKCIYIYISCKDLTLCTILHIDTLEYGTA